MMTYKTIDCPKCQGEGSVIAIVGSYFSSNQEAYYPDEALMECNKCFGCGSIEVPVLSANELSSLQQANIKQVEGFSLSEIIVLANKQRSAA